jgi:hypothetical protein
MKKSIFIIGTLLTVISLFGCKSEKQGGSNIYKIDETYIGLREKVFNITPDDIGLKKEGSGQVWGFVMETGYTKGMCTLIALADGTTSVYFSTGGGYIGLGQREQLQRISQVLLNTCEHYINLCTHSSSNPLPEQGKTCIYILTWDDRLSFCESEEVLGKGESELSPLFMQAHALISEVRMIDEKM